MANFIERHPGLTGLLAVCGTYLGGMIVQRKHVEKVNDQRLKCYEIYQGQLGTKEIGKKIKNVDDAICEKDEDDS